MNVSDEITNRINKSFEKLYHKNDDGTFAPYVCIVCDRLLKHTDVHTASTNLLRKNESVLCERPEMCISKELRNCYSISMDTKTSNGSIANMLLSPRAPFLTRAHGHVDGFTCCRSCLYGLRRNQMPKYAIANGYFMGTAPPVLTDLTMIERALLTPVKTWGYCFTYTGGQRMGLQGSMTYFKTSQYQMKGNLHFQGRSHESISKAIAKIEALGLNNDIVVILHGWMTPAQKKAATKHNTIRVSKVLDAIRWLLENNQEWSKRNIDLEKIKKELENPIIIDKSKETKPSNEKEGQNIEESETFHVFFPDGTMNQVNGGQESMEVFRTIIKEKKQAGFQPSVQYDLHSQYVYDYKDNTLVNACIVQFPFGRGGLNESRLSGNGAATKSTNVDDYINHLSHISQKYFHEELFCLILYNMDVKSMMLKTASWKVRGGINADMISRDLTREDVESALADKREKTYNTNYIQSPGHAYVNAIDATAGNIPHTNHAAFKARKEAEAIQYEYGQASWFLTVTPDDDNSFLIQVYSQTDIDLSDIDISNVTDEELAQRAQQRTTLRIQFPGIAAFFFENALDIVIKDIIGWDVKLESSTECPGLFGHPNAFSAAIEEQGRGTLHVHMLIWSIPFSILREQLHAAKRDVACHAKSNLISSIDNVVTSKLIGEVFNIQQNMTPHTCTKQYKRYTDLPQVCDEAKLRFMRHQKGYAEFITNFASCHACGNSWSDMDLLKAYMQNVKKISCITETNTIIPRMKAHLIPYQTGKMEVDEQIVRAAYDKHIHTKSCFRSEKLPKHKRKDCVLRDFECRYRFPKRKKRKTEIVSIHQKPVSWYHWDGSFNKKHIHEINLQRSPYDAFQNESCTAITRSKLACNTNLSGLLPGPVACYAFKYNIKGTQEDDEACYDRILEATKKSLSQTTPSKSNHSIAVSRLLRASFAHQKTNVIKGTFASFLTRKKSRFMFSHNTTWCPIIDLKKIIKGDKAFSTIQHAGQVPFFECSALNYICRPFELELLTPYEFYSQYESVKLTKSMREKGSYMSFANIYDRQHPSYNKSTKTFFKCIAERDKRCLVKFSPYLFPDPAQFGGSLSDPNLPNTPLIEIYCESVLILFYNYRRLEDLQINGSFHQRLSNIICNGELSPKTKTVLQNIVDCRSNATRYKSEYDDLQRNTIPFATTHDNFNTDDQDEDECNEHTADMSNLEELISQLEQTDDSYATQHNNKKQIPHELSLSTIRGYGKHRCGYEHVVYMKGMEETNTSPFIINDNVHDRPTDVRNDTVNQTLKNGNKAINERDFVRILLTKTTRRQRVDDSNLNANHTESRLEANGSVASIFDWAVNANLDSRQKRAFEIFSATFIMTFYNDAIRNHDDYCVEFSNAKHDIFRLLEKKPDDNPQLICFLHGPAGCGKSTVVDLFIEYAKEFSTFLPGFSFNVNTIRVTAMSGVAATLIGGETTHSALYLNQTLRISPEHIEQWDETRMIIIDEISFASGKQLRLIHSRLAMLKQKQDLPYGGIHIIFLGDMRQLEPCKPVGQPIYDDYCLEFDGWINTYLTLHGKHRFKHDPHWGEILNRFREGTVKSSDIDEINSRVPKRDQHLPDGIRYATFYNRCRDAINAAIFEKRCSITKNNQGIACDSIVIFSDNIKIKNHEKKYIELQNCHHFWETCGEQHVNENDRKGRMDPVLRLYTGCLVMFTYNKDVPNGIANGTQGLINRIYLNYGVPTRFINLSDETKVRAVYASEIKSIEVKHVNKRIHPPVFSVTPISRSCTVRMLKPRQLRSKPDDREHVKIKCKQIPLVVNNATTGHKLQGVGVKLLFVHEWLYGANWPYVVLSRVETLKGLYIRKPIKKDLKAYAMPKKLQRMIDRLESKSPTYWNTRQYKQLFVTCQL